MKVAILSAGPSLTRTYPPRKSESAFDVRITVNAAAGLFACDHWVCGDGETFARTVSVNESDPSTPSTPSSLTPQGSPLPHLYTIDRNDGHFRRSRHTLKRQDGYGVVSFADLRERVTLLKPPSDWTDWSITAALVLAVALGATEVHVFGHDMDGAMDVSGHELFKRHENWRRVRTTWIDVWNWATDRGVQVVRVTDETVNADSNFRGVL